MAYLFIVIGCGGIGGAVARDLPKLIEKTNHRMILVDGDKVEKKNTIRQPYQSQDIGYNKARALSKKINSFYKINCLSFDKYITNEELDMITNRYKDLWPCYLGCVDNDATRLLIEHSFKKNQNAAYIDGANSEYEGNIYFAKIVEGKQIGPVRSDVYTLSNDVNPGLIGCEEQLSTGKTQYFITNNKVASIILEKIDSLITQNDKQGVTIVERFKTISY